MQILQAQAAGLPENTIGGRWLVTEQFTATVTAYSSSPDETDSTPNITANGEHTGEGGIACPRRFAFGTLFYINEIIYRCNDRMALRFDNRFDLWQPSKQEARQFGLKKLDIRVIESLY